MSYPVRGIIEGFYGAPWSHRERLDLLQFCGQNGLNLFVYAPKDDPYHRESWREPYPAPALERLGELVAAGRTHGVDFAWTIAPGLSIDYASDDDFRALVRKAEQLRSIGATTQLLFDDIPEGDIAAGQARVSNRFLLELGGPLVVCPTDYGGTHESAYRQVLAAELDPEIGVYWTGPEVVSNSITREDAEAARAAFGGRELWLWDNYPVNDFEPSRLHLGPLTGRDPDLPVHAYIANGMIQAGPSKLAFATQADYARDSLSYDPVSSFDRALASVGGGASEALRVFASGEGDLRAATTTLIEELADASFVAAARPWLDAVDGRPRYEKLGTRALPVAPPGVAWDDLVSLGWAESEGHVFLDDAISIVEPGHPLAAGLSGIVRVYRGPAWLRYAHPVAGAVVVARDLKQGRPVLFAHESPRRVGFFVGADAELTPRAAGCWRPPRPGQPRQRRRRLRRNRGRRHGCGGCRRGRCYDDARRGRTPRRRYGLGRSQLDGRRRHRCNQRRRTSLLFGRRRALRSPALDRERPRAARRRAAARGAPRRRGRAPRRAARRCRDERGAHRASRDGRRLVRRGSRVDAGYEGDLMAAAGVPYAVGREPRSLYGEAWAGRQPATRPGKHNFPIVLSPFDDEGALLPHIRAPDLELPGA